jgi:cytoskeletal protein RodZ
MRERALSKHRPRCRIGGLTVPSLVMVAALGAMMSPLSAQEAVDARIQALERQMEEMRRTMQSMEAELEALRKAPPPEAVAAPAPVPPEEEPSVVRDQSPQETITTTEQATEPVVSSSQPQVKVSVSGQVNRALNVANDGESTKAYFVDSDVSNSRLRVLGLANYDEDIRFGGLLEVAFSPNNSSDVSQDNEDSDDLIDVRRADTGVDSKRFGRFWLGKGSAATDNVAEYDLSGLDVIMYAGVADIVGGLQFRDDDGDLTGLSVADAFFDFDGDRQDRVRYDTPMFGPGMQFSASAGEDQRYDASLNWGGDFDQWSGVEVGPFTTLAAIGISDPSEDGVDYRLMGSGALLHNPTGLNLTVSGGMDQADDGDPYNLYVKGGWYATLNRLGNTGFGIDFTRGHDVSADGDTGYSVGGAVVQTIEGYGAELYSQLRWYTLDRDDAPSVDDIVVGTLGTRVKF